MSRKRNMPSRKEIFNFWNGKIKSVVNDNTCFKCGVTSILDKDIIIVDRAHILAVCEGGSDDLDNLHLLCRRCHRDSEVYSGKEYNLWFLSKDREQFSKCLFVLWHKGQLKNTGLNKYFNNLKLDYINKYGQIWYDSVIYGYEQENKNVLDFYKKEELYYQ